MDIPEDIVDIFEGTGPPGPPLATSDIAAEFDGAEATVADRLDTLVAEGVLRTSVVDGDTRVWWLPGTESPRQTERDAFRVRLADELRPLTDPVEIQETAARVLGERLDVDRALYVEVFPDGETLQTQAGYPREYPAELDTKHQFSDFGADAAATLRRGDPMVVDDVTAIDDQSAEQEAAYLSVDIHAYLSVPLLKEGRLVGLFTLHQATPREWDETAVELTRETVERTWEAVERARAEATLAETNADLERLNAATRELIDADVATLRGRVAGLAREVLDCASATLWCYDEGHLGVTVNETAPSRATDAHRPPDDLDDRVWETFVTGDHTVIDDIDGPDGVPASPADEPLRSRALVPIGRHGVLGVASTEPVRFDDQLLNLFETFAAAVETAWDRAEGAAELQRRNRELTRLDELNTLIRRIDTALVEAETVDTIDEAVCARLAESELFEFAWVGGYDGDADTVEPREWAGVDSSAVEALAGTNADGESPPLSAVRSGELQAVSDIATDARAAPWREVALERGARSCRCIPLVYEEAVYGVVVVYGSTVAHDARDDEVLVELGRTIAHAINAVETTVTRQRDSVVELTLRTTTAQTPLCRLAREADCDIESDGRVFGTSDEPTVVFTARDVDPAVLSTIAAELLGFETFSVLAQEGAETLCKAQLTDESLAAQLQVGAGTVRTLTIESGVATAVVTLPETAAVRTYIDRVSERVPDVELVARHTRERPPDAGSRLQTAFRDRLTPRQQEVLSMAYQCGFFESPRLQTGAEIADAVGIAQSTFNYHLRGAQRALLAEVFDD